MPVLTRCSDWPDSSTAVSKPQRHESCRQATEHNMPRIDGVVGLRGCGRPAHARPGRADRTAAALSRTRGARVLRLNRVQIFAAVAKPATAHRGAPRRQRVNASHPHLS